MGCGNCPLGPVGHRARGLGLCVPVAGSLSLRLSLTGGFLGSKWPLRQLRVTVAPARCTLLAEAGGRSRRW